MALIRVYPHLDPRVIEVQSPTTDITIQELTDLIKDWEDEPPNLTYPILIRTYGKQALGSGAFVGITAVLQNAKISFEARSGPTEVLCNITAGNLVALDSGGSSMNPISPTAYTQVVIQQSTSPSIITPPEDLNMLYLIESLRGTHKSIGSVFYWDPTNGSDSNAGTQPSTAMATFSAAQALTTAGNHDVIFCLADGTTTVTEQLNITTSTLKVRGPGNTFQLIPSGTSAATVIISANDVELSGMFVKTAATGTQNGIEITGDNTLIKDVWVNSTRGHGIDISSAARTRLQTCAVEDCGGGGTYNGVNMGSTTTRSLVSQCIFTGNTGDGVSLAGSGLTDNIFENNLIYNNSLFGIDVGSGVTRTGVRLHHTFSGNTSGSTNDNGTDTFIETSAGGGGSGATAAEIADAVWNELINDHQGAGSAGKTLKDAKTRATLASLK